MAEVIIGDTDSTSSIQRALSTLLGGMADEGIRRVITSKILEISGVSKSKPSSCLRVLFSSCLLFFSSDSALDPDVLLVFVSPPPPILL